MLASRLQDFVRATVHNPVTLPSSCPRPRESAELGRRPDRVLVTSPRSLVRCLPPLRRASAGRDELSHQHLANQSESRHDTRPRSHVPGPLRTTFSEGPWTLRTGWAPHERWSWRFRLVWIFSGGMVCRRREGRAARAAPRPLKLVRSARGPGAAPSPERLRGSGSAGMPVLSRGRDPASCVRRPATAGRAGQSR